VQDLIGRLLAAPKGRALLGAAFAFFWILSTVATATIIGGTVLTSILAGLGGAMISMTVFLLALSRTRRP
jgi:hypothetical protein